MEGGGAGKTMARKQTEFSMSIWHEDPYTLEHSHTPYCM